MSKRIQSKVILRQKKAEYLKNLSAKLDEFSEKVSVILVHPKYQGNIGAIARLMKNSGLTDLRLVSSMDIENEAVYRSMSGREILENASRYESLEDAIKGFTVVAATSSSPTYSDRKFLRLPSTPEAFWNTNLHTAKKIALVFGREDDGLRNEEIELCNAFMFIPANPDYPVFNLSHAVSIILYEMVKQIPESDSEIVEPISPENFDLLLQGAEELMDILKYPKYKRPNADVMIKKIASRTKLTESEFFKIMGILRFLKYKASGSKPPGEKEEQESRKN